LGLLVCLGYLPKKLCSPVSLMPLSHDKWVVSSLFVWLMADGWCWFVLRQKYCWLVADG
jgi:hypothetical protein